MPGRWEDGKEKTLFFEFFFQDRKKGIGELAKMYELSERETWLTKEIVDCAFKVHSKLGPGLVERLYEACFCHELKKKGIGFRRQVDLPIIYDGIYFNEGLRLDVFVDELIICELKAVEILNPVWAAQVRSHLKLLEKLVGFVLNFNVPLIRDGIRRICLA